MRAASIHRLRTCGLLLLLLGAKAAADPLPPPDPRLGQRTDGRSEISVRDELLVVPRLLLAPPRVALRLIGYPLEALLALDQKYSLQQHFSEFMTSDDHLRGLRPSLGYSTGFSPFFGVSYFDQKLLGRASSFGASINAGYKELIVADLSLRPRLISPYHLQVGGHYIRRNDLLFAGIGYATENGFLRNTNVRGRYGIDQIDADVALEIKPHRFVTLHLVEAWAYRSFHDGRDVGKDKPVSRSYCERGFAGRCTPAGRVDESFLPGFADGADYFATDAGITFSTWGNDAHPSLGVHTELGARYAQGVDLGSRWVLAHGSFTGAVPLGSKHRVLLLRVATELIENLGPNPIPFSELVTLGGADSLRGFRAGSFRDKSSILTTVEYRWAIWMWMDAALFADWGGVFGERYQGVDVLHMLPDIGIGFRFRTDHHFRMRLQIAYGFGEGVQLMLATTTGL